MIQSEYKSNDLLIDIADLSVIFLTYDEPKKEEFWIKIQNMIPWATRVDGVKGSDSAHKAAADASDTDRFVLIDGDNIPDIDFFNKQISIQDWQQDCVFRWKARNAINGLCYGNGGISLWTKDFVHNMKTHENSDGSADTAVEFCFDPKYLAMHNCYSTTYPNQSPFQAFRAGFREGVKMCLDRGVKPSLKEFEKRAHARNLDNLCIWMTIGADVDNGEYAMYGAKVGTHMTMLGEDWNYTEVHDFAKIKEIWDTLQPSISIAEHSQKLDSALKNRLNLPISTMNAEQSKFFKHHYATTHKNVKNAMITEIDFLNYTAGLQ